MILVVLVFKLIIFAGSAPLDKSKTVTRLVIGKKDVGDKVNKLLNPEKNKAGFAEHNPEDDKKEEPLKDDKQEGPLKDDNKEEPLNDNKKEEPLNAHKKEEPLNDDKKEEPSKDDKKDEALKDFDNNTLSKKEDSDPAPLNKTVEKPEKKSPEKPEINNKTEVDNKTVTDNKTDNKEDVSSKIRDDMSDKNINNEEKPSKANSGEPVDDADKKTTSKADDVKVVAKTEDPPLNLDPKNKVKNETTTPDLTSSTTTATEKPTEAKKSKSASRHVDSDESSSQSDSSQIKTREEGVVSIPSGDSKRFQI
jgi:hypothetical protein